MNFQNGIESSREIGIFIGIKFPNHFHNIVAEFFLKILHPDAFIVSTSLNMIERLINMRKILTDVLEVIFYIGSAAHFHPYARHLAEINIILPKTKIAELDDMMKFMKHRNPGSIKPV